MAFTNTTQVSQYNGNGVTTAFSTGFYFLTNADVVVTLTDSSGVDHSKALLTDFTLTGALNSTGGTVTMFVAPATGEILTIARVVPMTQETDYVSGDAFPEETHERALDKAMMAASQVKAEAERAFRVRRSDGQLAVMELINNGIVGTSSSGVPTILTGAQVQALLNLPGTVIDQPTKTFLDAAARGAATPDFLGQIGAQLDTSTIYLGSSITAGGWDVYDFTVAADSVATVNIQASAVTTAKIADTNVTAAKLATDAVETAKIKDANVTTAKLADSSVTAAKIAAGAVVQFAKDEDASALWTTATFAFGGAVPLVSEGLEVLSVPITLSGATNTVLAKVSANVGSSGANNVALALFRGSTCIQSGYVTPSNADFAHMLSFEILDTPGAGTHTYSVRLGGSAGSSYINRNYSGAGARLLGGSSKAVLHLMEIKA